jgi:hypothetical protein
MASLYDSALFDTAVFDAASGDADPIIIAARSDGYRLRLRRSQLTAMYAALGFSEERVAVYDTSADGGTWDGGGRYIIRHTDGTIYGVSYNNWLNRYADAPGWTLVGPE